MQQRVFVWMACATVLLASAGTAHAQYGTRSPSTGPPGEAYHVEAALNFWSPARDIVISSEQLGIVGTTIDAVEDLGFERERFREWRIVLRPTRKFKLRVGRTPIKYEAETVLQRTIIFNGQRYDVGLPVASELSWNAWKFGLEYDFFYTDRGFAGFILEAKYTDVDVTLASPITTEFTSVTAPIPTIGGIGRIYVTPSFSITGELTGLKLKYQEDEGTYIDFDINGTYSFTRNFGAQAGYRRLKVDYVIESDQGNFTLKGLYFGGVVRF